MENIQAFEQIGLYSNEYSPFYNLNDGHHFVASSQPTLVEKLQTTLELDKLLEIYAKEAFRYVSFCGLSFSHDDNEIAVRGSVPGRHRLCFDIKVDNQSLGQLAYNINKELTKEQFDFLDKFHHQLRYPLRNAISFYQVKKMAIKDNLTGLGNRCYYDENIERMVQHANRHRSHFSLMVLDLDEFKQVNDTHGHQRGDEVLREFSDILNQSVRGSDRVFRLGGDEFVIILEGEQSEGMKTIAARIQHHVANSKLMVTNGVSTSIGCATFEPGETAQEIFERADKALYNAKNVGKNCTRIA